MALQHVNGWRARVRSALLGAALACALPLAGAAGPDALVVGTNPTFPPFEMVVDGEVTGFDVDAIRAMAKTQGMEVTVRPMPFNGIIPSLQVGSINVAGSGITITRERLKNVDFTAPYYRSGLTVLVKEGSAIRGFDDLQDHVVGTQKATSSAQYLARHGIAESHIKQFQDINGAYQALVTGGVDAVLFDNPVNVMFKARHPGVQIVGELLTGEYYGFAVSKKSPGLVEKLDRGLAAIKQDGTYRQLFDKYFGGDMSGAVTGDETAESVAIGD